MDTAQTSPSVALGAAETKWKTFLYLLLAATLVPFLFIPFSVQAGQGASSVVAIAAFLNFVGSGVHVSASAFLYTDQEMRDHFAGNKARYYYSILALVIGTGTLYYLLDDRRVAYLMLIYFVWQNYHYQRQNYGILSFIASGTDRLPPSFCEKAVLQSSVWFGILGLLKVYNLTVGTRLAPFTDQLYLIGEYGFCLVLAFFIAALATSKSLRRNPLRVLFLAIGGIFYFPIFLFHDPISAVSGYALGHGLQYLVFMYFVGSSKPDRDIRIISLTVIALVGGAALTLLADRALWGGMGKFIFGAYLGLVVSHFVIDAGVWKLREPFQRSYMRNAFNFVFTRRPASPPTAESADFGDKERMQVAST